MASLFPPEDTLDRLLLLNPSFVEGYNRFLDVVTAALPNRTAAAWKAFQGGPEKARVVLGDPWAFRQYLRSSGLDWPVLYEDLADSIRGIAFPDADNFRALAYCAENLGLPIEPVLAWRRLEKAAPSGIVRYRFREREPLGAQYEEVVSAWDLEADCLPRLLLE